MLHSNFRRRQIFITIQVFNSTMPKQKKTRAVYTNEDLEKALGALNAGKTLGSVSKTFNIPKSTLFDKRHGHSKPVVGRPGPESILGEFYEKKLVQWIMCRADDGIPVTKDQLMNSVQKLMKTLRKDNTFTDDRPGRHWFEAFQKRHPEIRGKVSENMTFTRAAVTEEKIRQWFDRLETYLISRNLLDIQGSRVFTCDEFGFYLCPKGQRVLVKRGDRSAYNFVNNDENECVTALFCGNAAGQYVPLAIMFNYVRIPAIVPALTPKDYTICRSESGWMTTSSFFDWVRHSFHPWVVKNEIELPVVLYIDGHSPHLTLQLTEYCQQNNIELIGLYPNSTHLLQPMDVAVFHPLKNAWRQAVPEWRMNNGGDRLKREHFGAVLKEAIDKMSWENILFSGFQATGLYPLNPDAIIYSKQLKTANASRPQVEQTPTIAPTATIIPQTATLIPLVPTEYSEMTCIEFVEENIDSELLQTFKLVDDAEEWSGDISQTGLFLFWRRIKNGHR